MELKHKIFPACQVKAVDETLGICEMIVAVFNNVDAGNERILPGAFLKSLSRRLPKGVWMHDWKQPVAKTLVAEEWLVGDPRLPESLSQLGGLYIKGQFNMGTQRGKEAFSDLSFGTVDEFSIGYFPTKVQQSTDTAVLDLVEIDLAEWSPVLLGMNPATALLSAKSSRAGLKYADEVTQALAAMQSLSMRTARLIEVRRKEGRQLSAANISRLESIHEALGTAHADLGKLLDATKPKDEGKAQDGAPALIDGSDLYARFIAQLHGVTIHEPTSRA